MVFYIVNNINMNYDVLIYFTILVGLLLICLFIPINFSARRYLDKFIKTYISIWVYSRLLR